MKTLQFEGVKVALKQDKTGYVLTLSMHPDDIPEELLRDFVGSRYQVVMVRINQNEEPMDRQEEFEGDRAIDEDMEDATEWIRNYLNVPSRSDLKTNRSAQILLDRLHKEFQEWTQKN